MTEARSVICYDKAIPVDGKTAISVRDGVVEYLGAELGIMPADQMFTVYRSPATIANAAPKMVGIPLTNGHVDVGADTYDTDGTVSASDMIDMFNDSCHSTVGIRNKIAFTDAAKAEQVGSYELSLGYRAELVPHDKYDFEQRDINPHHLAYVPEGRCGFECRFIDAKPEGAIMADKKAKGPSLHKAFCDAEGGVNLEGIIEIAMALPEAMKKVPVVELQKLLPAMQELIAMSKDAGVVVDEVEVEDEQEELPVEDKQEELQDEEPEEEKKGFADSKAFQDAVMSAVNNFAEVVDKAKLFVDEGYDFKGKTAKQIMADAVKTQQTTDFSDSELPVAFKMLKKSGDYANFGDQSVSEFQSLKNKEL